MGEARQRASACIVLLSGHPVGVPVNPQTMVKPRPLYRSTSRVSNDPCSPGKAKSDVVGV